MLSPIEHGVQFRKRAQNLLLRYTHTLCLNTPQQITTAQHISLPFVLVLCWPNKIYSGKEQRHTVKRLLVPYFTTLFGPCSWKVVWKGETGPVWNASIVRALLQLEFGIKTRFVSSKPGPWCPCTAYHCWSCGLATRGWRRLTAIKWVWQCQALLRTLGEKLVVANTFGGWNQRSVVMSLEPGSPVQDHVPHVPCSKTKVPKSQQNTTIYRFYSLDWIGTEEVLYLQHSEVKLARSCSWMFLAFICGMWVLYVLIYWVFDIGAPTSLNFLTTESTTSV